MTQTKPAITEEYLFDVADKVGNALVDANFDSGVASLTIVGETIVVSTEHEHADVADCLKAVGAVVQGDDIRLDGVAITFKA